MKKRNNRLSVVIGALLGTVITVYAAGQRSFVTEAHPVIEPVTVVRELKTEEVAVEEPQTIYMGEFKLTAYCSCEKCCGKWAKNRPVDEEGKEIVIGASGEELIAGVSIAVDKEVIPYGTTVLINGQTYIAHDCGGAIKNNRIDVYFDSHQEALKFGVQYADVYLMKEGERND